MRSFFFERKNADETECYYITNSDPALLLQISSRFFSKIIISLTAEVFDKVQEEISRCARLVRKEDFSTGMGHRIKGHSRMTKPVIY